jgi:uncharacterized protein (DUF58 family)
MSYTGERAGQVDGRRLSKFEYARYLAASLAYLLIHQQDAVGLVTFDTQVRRYIPARSRTSHLTVLLNEMTRTVPGNETSLAPIFHDIAERVHRRGLVIVVSDLFDDPEPLMQALHHFRFRKHEVMLLHVMADEELSFPFTNTSMFEDLEDDDSKLQLDPRAIRAEYLDRVREFIAHIESRCGQMRIDYVPMTTREPFDAALARYLAARRSRQ